MQLPPPGWYEDPLADPQTLRWWDGGRWTEAVCRSGEPAHVSGAVAAAAPPRPGPVPVWAPPGTSPMGAGPMGAGPTGAGPIGAARVDRSGDPGRVIPARAAWWGLLGLLIGEVVGGILAEAASVFTGSTTDAGATLAGEIGLWSGMLAAVLFVSRRYGSGSVRADFGLAFSPGDLGWGPLVAVIGLVLEGILATAFAGSRLAGTNTQLITGQKGHTAGFAVITVVVAVGAPLFEELFFRGLLRTSLRSSLGPTGAALAQAGLFGLAHVNPATGLGNVEVVVVIGALGLVLGLTANLTGRLAAGMIGHGLFNLLATISILVG